MTEFRRAASAVDALEALSRELCAAAAAAAPGDEPPEALRARYKEARAHLSDVGPVAEKMRRKVQARADLEVVRAELRQKLPGAPEESVKAAQEVVDAGGEGAADLQPLLDRALELEGVATYGAKMVEKVQDLLARLDAAAGGLDAQVAPFMDAAVAAADAIEAAGRASREAAAREAAELEARRAEEQARSAVNSLKEEAAQRLREQREAEEAEEQRQAEERAAEARAEAARAAEEEVLRRAEADGELRLAEVGPDAACGEALAAMLASPVGAYREALEALSGMFGSIAGEPQEARLRVIRAANSGFQERLGRRPGVWLFLRGAGFEPLERQALPGGLLPSLGLGPGPPSERFLLLREPDMMGEYEKWLAWHDRLRSIADFLGSLAELALRRTAHLGQAGLDVPAQGLMQASEVVQRWEACRGGS